MPRDFLEELADLEVAPPPAEFGRQLHQRVNRWLLARHLLDFVVAAMPWAAIHFFRAVGGIVVFSITGRFADERRKKP